MEDTLELGRVTDRKPPFKYSALARVWFSDTDAQGIVYYGRYLPYFDHARVEYHRHLLRAPFTRTSGVGSTEPPKSAGAGFAGAGAGSGVGSTEPPRSAGAGFAGAGAGSGDLVMRAIDVEYHAPARFDDLIEAFVRVRRIGRTSMTYECAAHRLSDDELMVTAELTVVLVDLEARRPIPIPDDIRDAIRAFEGDDLEE